MNITLNGVAVVNLMALYFRLSYAGGARIPVGVITGKSDSGQVFAFTSVSAFVDAAYSGTVTGDFKTYSRHQWIDEFPTCVPIRANGQVPDQIAAILNRSCA